MDILVSRAFMVDVVRRTINLILGKMKGLKAFFFKKKSF